MRGVAGVDERRVISGIIHKPKSGGRWVDALACYGRGRPSTPVRALGWKGHLARAARNHGGSRRATVGSPDRQHAFERASLCGGRKRGAFAQAIGISRGGRSSKPYALTDGEGRPFRFLLTPKNVTHARAALQLLNALPLHAIVLAYRAYDGGAIRALIEEQGAVPNIPPKVNRK